MVKIIESEEEYKTVTKSVSQKTFQLKKILINYSLKKFRVVWLL